MEPIEEAIANHYGQGRVLMAARVLPDDLVTRAQRARAAAVCAGCQQPITERIKARIVGASWYHPSCGARAAGLSNVSNGKHLPPTIIGRIVGAAVPLGTPCYVESAGGSELFMPGAFNRAIEAPQTVTLRVGHQGTDVAGIMRLGIEDHALQFTFDVFDTAEGRAVLERARSEGYAGASISFQHEPGAREWDAYGREHWRAVDLQHIALIPHGGAPSWYGTHVRSI